MKLLEGLNKLCSETESFYFSEQQYNEKYIIRSFSYRLASWSDFKLPYAKDARGTAFLFNKETKEWTLFTRAYRKFFNLGEGIPAEVFIKDHKPLASFEKIDGSLILVGRIDDKLVAKSKTSINSDHAKIAQELIDNNSVLQKHLNDVINRNETPVMELVGPGELRIVLNYDNTELVWLGSVKNEEYAVNTDRYTTNIGIKQAKQYSLSWKELLEIKENSKPDIEGYVVRVENQDFVKVKVNQYVELHHAKDSFNNPKNLIKSILDDNLDDLMGLLQYDKEAMKRLMDIQQKVFDKHNHLVATFKDLMDKYYNEHNSNRKEFALKYKKAPMFSAVMRSLNTQVSDMEKLAEKYAKEHIINATSTLTKATQFLEGE